MLVCHNKLQAGVIIDFHKHPITSLSVITTDYYYGFLLYVHAQFGSLIFLGCVNCAAFAGCGRLLRWTSEMWEQTFPPEDKIPVTMRNTCG